MGHEPGRCQWQMKPRRSVCSGRQDASLLFQAKRLPGTANGVWGLFRYVKGKCDVGCKFFLGIGDTRSLEKAEDLGEDPLRHGVRRATSPGGGGHAPPLGELASGARLRGFQKRVDILLGLGDGEGVTGDVGDGRELFRLAVQFQQRPAVALGKAAFQKHR